MLYISLWSYDSDRWDATKVLNVCDFEFLKVLGSVQLSCCFNCKILVQFVTFKLPKEIVHEHNFSIFMINSKLSIVGFCKFLGILNYFWILYCSRSFIFYVGNVLDRDNLWHFLLCIFYMKQDDLVTCFSLSTMTTTLFYYFLIFMWTFSS